MGYNFQFTLQIKKKAVSLENNTPERRVQEENKDMRHGTHEWPSKLLNCLKAHR